MAAASGSLCRGALNFGRDGLLAYRTPNAVFQKNHYCGGTRSISFFIKSHVTQPKTTIPKENRVYEIHQ
jgi:hypothetical protein